MAKPTPEEIADALREECPVCGSEMVMTLSGRFYCPFNGPVHEAAEGFAATEEEITNEATQRARDAKKDQTK